MEYGLIGHPLGHSFSKEIHESITDYTYELRDLTNEEFDDFFRSRNFKAINVTIPYKQKVIPYLSEIEEKALDIGAVNTIVNRDGLLYGYNTDVMGLYDLIDKNCGDLTGKTVLILGSGGTSKTAAYAVKNRGAGKIYKATRQNLKSESCFDYINYNDLDRIADQTDVIINTTPVGMYPDIFETPVDPARFPKLSCVLDAVYNPLRTKLVSEAKKLGISAEGGLYMLVSQAVYAIELFLEKSLCEEVKNQAYRRIVTNRENIVLTGMPGAGKSSVGKIISDITGKRFIDTDDIIDSRFGKTSDIIRREGEESFRKIETEVIKSIAGESGCCIATGGGAVLSDKNMEFLRMNGRIVFLDRELSELVPSDDRPLSSTMHQVAERYHERYYRYVSTSDMQVIVSSEQPETTARRILEEIGI